jgi:hypothetical protein
MIQKSEVLRLMERTKASGTRIPFQIAFITADRAKWKQFQRLSNEEKIKASIDYGGRLITHNQCILSGPRGKHAAARQATPEITVKHPRNSANRTRNIIFLPARQTRKLHNSLIIEFNNEEVIY